MLPKVDVDKRSLEEFKGIIPDKQYSEISDLANKLKGLKVVHINATPEGGGPAMILQSLVPLMIDVGIETEWYVIPPEEKFFKILMTKQLHNAMQGDDSVVLSSEEKSAFYEHSKLLSSMVKDLHPDIWVLHDLQTWGMGRFIKDRGKGVISRIHVDSTHPNKEVWDFLSPYGEYYDRVVFSMDEFIPPEISQNKSLVFTPAIDPFMEQNKDMPLEEARTIVKKFGIDVSRPIMVNISRFDPWKDPEGTVEVYRRAKKQIPGLQLVFVGLMLADDDPDAEEIFEKMKSQTKDDSDVFLFAELSPLKDKGIDVPTFVRAFRSAADVIIHKSSREGFGMTVAESMLFGKPVIGGNIGGIKVQIIDGENGYLVDSVEEAASRAITLFNDADLRESMGKMARKRIQDNFLTPRLLLNYLKMFEELA